MEIRRNILSSPWFPLGIIFIGDLFMVADVLPRSAAFFLALLAVIFVARTTIAAAVFFAIASAPFAPALPIPGFDSFAAWRLTVATLLIRTAWEYRTRLRHARINRAAISAIRSFEWLGFV